MTPDASVVPGSGLSKETSCRCESWPRGSPAHSAADIGNISDSQITRSAANYGLSTLQCNVSCRQIMILVLSGQLRCCHPLINWSGHDTHTHTDTLYNNPMIIIWGLIFTKFTYPHDQAWATQPCSLTHGHSGLPPPLPLSPHITHRLLPSPNNISGIGFDLGVTRDDLTLKDWMNTYYSISWSSPGPVSARTWEMLPPRWSWHNWGLTESRSSHRLLRPSQPRLPVLKVRARAAIICGMGCPCGQSVHGGQLPLTLSLTLAVTATGFQHGAECWISPPPSSDNRKPIILR